MEEDNSFFSIIEDIYRFKQLMNEHRLILMYTDTISSNTHENLVAIAEDKLSAHTTENRVKRKVFNVMMECIQNVSRHGQKDTESLMSSVFIVGKDSADRFFIVSGNNIAKEEERELRERLDKLNSLNPEELHEYYLEVIDNGEMSDKGGAGLGFIDIARKSKSKIEYYFRPVNEKHLFFLIKVNIEEGK